MTIFIYGFCALMWLAVERDVLAATFFFLLYFESIRIWVEEKILKRKEEE